MYDLAVIGGGPGGYAAAIRGAQAGLKTVLVEKESLGGTCLNRGCIPTKCLIHDVKLYAEAKKSMVLNGRESLQINLDAAMQRKTQVVERLVSGVATLLKKNKVEVFQGTGSLRTANTIQVKDQNGSEQTLTASKVILAMGSKPSVPGFIQVDGTFVQTTDQALMATEVPEQVVIVGGGVIGMELAGLYSRIGAKVHVVEMLPDILMTEDKDIRKTMTRELKKAKVSLYLGARVQQISAQNRQVEFTDKKGQQQTLSCDRVIVATGRSPVLTGLEALDPPLEMEGPFVKVDGFLETSLPGVYAIGDLTGGMMLAHKASADAENAVEHILGKLKQIRYQPIPRCIWGLLEVGAVGLTEDQACAAHFSVKTGTFPFTACGAAQAMDQPQGLVKIVSESEKKRLIGMHIIGPQATELIAQAVSTMAMHGTVEDLAAAIRPHPTLSEAVQEAALDWSGQALHKALIKF